MLEETAKIGSLDSNEFYPNPDGPTFSNLGPNFEVFSAVTLWSLGRILLSQNYVLILANVTTRATTTTTNSNPKLASKDGLC